MGPPWHSSVPICVELLFRLQLGLPFVELNPCLVHDYELIKQLVQIVIERLQTYLLILSHDFVYGELWANAVTILLIVIIQIKNHWITWWALTSTIPPTFNQRSANIPSWILSTVRCFVPDRPLRNSINLFFTDNVFGAKSS